MSQARRAGLGNEGEALKGQSGVKRFTGQAGNQVCGGTDEGDPMLSYLSIFLADPSSLLGLGVPFRPRGTWLEMDRGGRRLFGISLPTTFYTY